MTKKSKIPSSLKKEIETVRNELLSVKDIIDVVPLPGENISRQIFPFELVEAVKCIKRALENDLFEHPEKLIENEKI